MSNLNEKERVKKQHQHLLQEILIIKKKSLKIRDIPMRMGPKGEGGGANNGQLKMPASFSMQ